MSEITIVFLVAGIIIGFALGFGLAMFFWLRSIGKNLEGWLEAYKRANKG